MFLTNIFFNLLFGIIGDKVGWRQTVTFFGGIGCAITTLAFYYVPLAVGPNLLVAMLVGAAYGATLAAFVPLSALMPSLAPENKGAAMSALNFGAGMSAFLGPLVVTLFLGAARRRRRHVDLRRAVPRQRVLAWQLQAARAMSRRPPSRTAPPAATPSARWPGWPAAACWGTRRRCRCRARTTTST